MTSSTSTCSVCGSPGHFFKPYIAQSSILVDRDIHQCSYCGFYYVHDMPTDIELLEYNSSYWSNAHCYSTSLSYSNSWFNLLATLRHNYLVDHINLENLSILEIGPGEGYLARTILSLHQNAQYDVVESDLSVHPVLSKLPVNLFSDLKSLPLSQQYDLVILSHVLEHVSNPLDTISSIKPLIRKSGHLFIEVPCLDFLYKDSHEPHLLFFDKPSLAFLLSKLSFHILDLTYAGNQISDLPKTRLSLLFLRILKKLLRIFPFLNILLPNIDSLESIDSYEQKLLSLFYSCHISSINPSCWLRTIAINSDV